MVTPDWPKFRPAAIEELMHRDGLTRREFAKHAGVSRQLLGAWVSGWTQPRYDTVLRLCATFGVDPGFFAEGLPERSKGSKRKVTP